MLSSYRALRKKINPIINDEGNPYSVIIIPRDYDSVTSCNTLYKIDALPDYTQDVDIMFSPILNGGDLYEADLLIDGSLFYQAYATTCSKAIKMCYDFLNGIYEEVDSKQKIARNRLNISTH